jgi:PST family polysaccharide transporter
MRGPYLSTAFFLRIILLAVGLIILLLAGPHFVSVAGVAVLLPIVGFMLVFDGLREFFFSLTRASEKMEWEAGAKVLTNSLIAILGVAFVVYRPTAASLSWSYLIGSALGFLFTLYILRKQLGELFSHFTPSLIKPILTSAWPFALAGIFSTIMINTDLFLLGFWRDAREIGLYSAALRPVGLLYMLPATFATAVFPALTRSAKDSEESFAHGFLTSIRFTIVGALPFMIGGVLLASPLTVLLFGHDFADAAPMMAALLLTLIVAFPGAVIVNALYATYKQKQIVWFIGIGATINALLDILFIPRWGGTGSAFATLIAQAIIMIPAWIFLARRHNFSVIPPGGRAVLASALVGVGVWICTLLQIPVLVTVAVGGVIYMIGLIAFKDSTLREITTLLKPRSS